MQHNEGLAYRARVRSRTSFGLFPRARIRSHRPFLTQPRVRPASNAGGTTTSLTPTDANRHFFIDTFETTLAPDLSLLAALRRALRTWLEDAGVADPARSELVLATHEAAANAIEHAASSSPVEIRARRAVASVVVEVRDHGRWQPPSVGTEERGRGLKLIESLVSALTIETDEDGTTIRLLQYT